jgi:hypothetical protein
MLPQRHASVRGTAGLFGPAAAWQHHQRVLPATFIRDGAAPRLLTAASDIVVTAQVPPACTPAADSSNITRAGCGAGCQSCKKQAVNGIKQCICCKAGYIPTKGNSATCTPCPKGTTAALAGSVICTSCTRGLTTSRTGATACNGKY